MNFEFLVTECENNHTSHFCNDDNDQLRPRTNTVPEQDLQCAAPTELFTPNGFNRAPLVSRDPQTSSLDRYLPSHSPFYHSPKPKKKFSPFSCKLNKRKAKSAQSSPAHSAVSSLAAGAEVEDLGGCNGENLFESNLDFGFRGDSSCSWVGSDESFSDLDRGMTRLASTDQFRARSMSCSSSGYSLTNTELSNGKSNESLPRLISPRHHLIISTCNALRKTCENDLDTTPKKHSSLPCRNIRSKSSGGMIIQKFSKKLSKLSLGGGTKGSGEGSGGGGGGGSKKKKNRSNSASRLEGGDRYVCPPLIIVCL